MLRLDLFIGADHDGTADNLVEFAAIEWPVMVNQSIEGVLGKAAHLFVVLGVESFQQAAGNNRDVDLPLPQRGHNQRFFHQFIVEESIEPVAGN